MSRTTKIEKSTLKQLYLIEKKSLDEIGVMFGCARPRVKTLLKQFKIEIRPQGGGNNRLYETKDGKSTIDVQLLKTLFELNYSWPKIIFLMNASDSLIKYAKKLGFNRVKNNSKQTDWQIYRNLVHCLTKKTYRKHKKIINPLNLPRKLCGTINGWQLDHIKSIRKCFDMKISPEECSSLQNLQMLSWKDNLDKRRYDWRQ